MFQAIPQEDGLPWTDSHFSICSRSLQQLALQSVQKLFIISVISFFSLVSKFTLICYQNLLQIKKHNCTVLINMGCACVLMRFCVGLINTVVSIETMFLLFWDSHEIFIHMHFQQSFNKKYNTKTFWSYLTTSNNHKGDKKRAGRNNRQYFFSNGRIYERAE